MFLPTNRQGYIVNQGGRPKIQPAYRPIIEEIEKSCFDNLGPNLLSIYLRGSVALGWAKRGISDVDGVAVIKKPMTRKKLLWTVHESQRLEKKYRLNLRLK